MRGKEEREVLGSFDTRAPVERIGSGSFFALRVPTRMETPLSRKSTRSRGMVAAEIARRYHASCHTRIACLRPRTRTSS